jgi:hypothetical protein
MNWLLKRLGYRDREYRGNGFHVGIKPIMREAVRLNYTRDRTKLYLDGELIGQKWEGISVHIPPEIDTALLPEIVRDLQTAFEKMGYGYVIARKIGAEIVEEGERQEAAAELWNMGYEVEVLADGKIRLRRREGAPHQDREALQQSTPRMMSLIHAVHGKRTRHEILAKSEGF